MEIISREYQLPNKMTWIGARHSRLSKEVYKDCTKQAGKLLGNCCAEMNTAIKFKLLLSSFLQKVPF